MNKLLHSNRFQWAYASVAFIAFLGQFFRINQTVHDVSCTILAIMALPLLVIIWPILKAGIYGARDGYQSNQSWRQSR